MRWNPGWNGSTMRRGHRTILLAATPALSSLITANAFTSWILPASKRLPIDASSDRIPIPPTTRLMSSPNNTPPSKRPLQPDIEPQASDQVDGARTKFGRRQRKVEDKATKNARVRNSYLKLTMDDVVFDQLHRLVQQTRLQWDDENKSSDDPPQDAVSKKQAKRRLSIKPRTRNSLHMTYFFAGKVLDDMPGDELLRWESMVKECVRDHNRRGGPGDYSLRFKHLTTFPPRRPNLIAAVFEASPALDSLYGELCNVAMMEKDRSIAEEEDGNAGNTNIDKSAAASKQENDIEYEFPLLRKLTWRQFKMRNQHRSQPSWLAHVTLGNLAGGSKDDVRRLDTWLRDKDHQFVNTALSDAGKLSLESSVTPSTPEVSSISTTEPKGTSLIETENACVLESNITVRGLALGGPVPEHSTDVDWKFPFLFDSAGDDA